MRTRRREDEDEDEDPSVSTSGEENDGSDEDDGADDDGEDEEEEEDSASESEGFDDDEFVVDEDDDGAEDADDDDDDDDDDDSVEDGEDDDEESDEETLARPVSSHVMGMSRAFQTLVGNKESSTAAAAEMLPKSKKQRQDEAEAKAEEKERRRIKRAKVELKFRGHVVPQPRGRDLESDTLERRLHHTATKGVVRLFNAVGKAQRDAEKAKTMRRKDALISKTKFLEELRGDKAKTKKDEKTEADSGATKASFLQDDFMLGRGKLKDWEKETIAAPQEVEYDDDDEDVF